MTSDKFSRGLAFFAIAVAVFIGATNNSCNCTDHPRLNRLGWILRVIGWAAASGDHAAEPAMDPGALRYENSPPTRQKGPTGEVELDHGHGW